MEDFAYNLCKSIIAVLPECLKYYRACWNICDDLLCEILEPISVACTSVAAGITLGHPGLLLE
jgi:hypothetical protein